jgi:hypothetical protein
MRGHTDVVQLLSQDGRADPAALESLNVKGGSALCDAAASGNTDS